MSLTALQLVGAWRLVDWRIEYRRGTSRPFGAGAGGVLVYTADGWMSATMWVGSRTPWSAASARQASVESRATAAVEYLNYCGRWRLEGDIVEHLVEGALNPLLIGTRQLREARLAGDLLVLAAEESAAASGAARRHVIEWRRPGSADA
jgi:hypothetical protein